MPSMKNKYFLIEMPQDLREQVKVAAIGQKETMKQFIKIAITHRIKKINQAKRLKKGFELEPLDVMYDE